MVLFVLKNFKFLEKNGVGRPFEVETYVVPMVSAHGHPILFSNCTNFNNLKLVRLGLPFYQVMDLE
jgi:hypothetical protein